MKRRLEGEVTAIPSFREADYRAGGIDRGNQPAEGALEGGQAAVIVGRRTKGAVPQADQAAPGACRLVCPAFGALLWGLHPLRVEPVAAALGRGGETHALSTDDQEFAEAVVEALSAAIMARG